MYFDIVIIILIVGMIWNQSRMNEKLNNIYTEVAEIHEKMGGWSNHEK